MRNKIANKIKKEILYYNSKEVNDAYDDIGYSIKVKIIKEEYIFTKQEMKENNFKKRQRGYHVILKINDWEYYNVGRDRLEAYKLALESVKETIDREIEEI